MSELTVAAIKKLKVAELKAELSKRGLIVKGKKDELAKRLMEAIGENACEVSMNTTVEEPDSQEVSSSADVNSQSSSQEEEPTPAKADSQTEQIEQQVEQSSEGNVEAIAEEEVAKPSTEENDAKGDDWVMVEPPSKEEQSEVEAVVAAVDSASVEQPATGDPSTAEIQQSNDVEMNETPQSEKKEDESQPAQSSGASKVETVVEEAKKTEESKKTEEPKTEEKKVDALVEVETEEGEDEEYIEIQEGHVGLEGYTSDLNFVISNNGLTGRNLVKNGFSYMWAGARANKGCKGGKVGYEVKIGGKLEVNLDDKEAPKNAVRIGWSVETSSLQLGESALSYGYESTGKVCASSSFFAYGEEFGEGDVIGTYLDLESEQKTLRYTKNGADLGVAMSLNLDLNEKSLVPHVFLRNMQVELNFGGLDEPWFEVLEGYTLLQNAGAENIADRSFERPESKDKCEMLLLVGLPNSGKSTWVRKYVESHPAKHYNVIGMNQLLERCKLEGKRRRKSDENHDKLMKAMMQILTKLYELCPKKCRNFIYDQNNVYEQAQTTKMESFSGFIRKGIVVVPTHDNLRKRTSEAKRKGDNIHDVPFADLCDMKCEFHLPTTGDLFDEIIFPELDDKNASKTVRDYQSDGARAKKTGKDEYYPRKRGRDDNRYSGRRDYGRERYDDGWKNSGSGYGGNNKSYSGSGNYGSHGRNSGGYHDQYRNSGGGSGQRGGSYGGSGGYGSGGYGGGYGGYGSGGYGGYGNYSGYNQSQSNRGAQNSGQWGNGQYGYNNQSQNQQQQHQQQSWGSSNNSGSWGGYNYNNYGSGGNSYGGSGYSY